MTHRIITHADGTSHLRHLKGWRPDPHDARDSHISLAAGHRLINPEFTSAKPPSHSDLRPTDPPVRDQGQIGSCHDDQTQVLTDSGWKLFSDTSTKDRLATVDPVTAELTFENPSHIVHYDFDGALVCGEHKFLNFNVTPDHNMLLRKWNQPKATLNKHYELIPASKIGWYAGLMTRVEFKGDRSTSNTYVLPGCVNETVSEQRSAREVDMGAWLRFLGVYLAEGTMIKREVGKYKVQIAAGTEAKHTFIKQACLDIGVTALELEDRFTFQCRQVYEAMSLLGLEGKKSGVKFVPDFVFQQSAANIKEFLAGHFAGDGCTTEGGNAHYTGSPQLAEDLQRLIFLSGNESYIGVRGPRECTMKDGRHIKGILNEHRVSVCEERNSSIERKHVIHNKPYKGTVWCATMPTHHTLVTRREGKILISGNCTAHGVSAPVERNELDHDPTNPEHTLKQMSTLYQYQISLIDQGVFPSDEGDTIRGAVKSAVKHGVVLESHYPYHPENLAKRPPAALATEAAQHKITSYHKIANGDLSTMKAVLASGYHVIFGFNVPSTFETQEFAANPILRRADVLSDELVGGHCVCLAGHDDTKKLFTVRNSWSASWGDRGHCYFDYAFVGDSLNFCSDFWIISSAPL